MTVAATGRIVASPYARRLARERGLDLAGRRGSGPNGRIVAADLLTGPAPLATRETTTPDNPVPIRAAAPQRAVSAFGASLDIGPLRALIPEIADVAPEVTVDDLLLKAVGRAVRIAELQLETLVWHDKSASTTASVPRADGLSPSRIAAIRVGQESEAPRGSVMTVSHIRQDGLRPVASVLDAGAAARLMLVFAETDAAEALLTFDEAAIDDASGARFLGALRDCLAVPLRLLV